MGNQVNNKIKNMLVVMDFEMKRLDANTEYHFMLLQECRKRNVRVEFILPVEPCDSVKNKLKDSVFHYTVLKNWWDRRDPRKKHNLKIVFPILQLIRSRKIDIVDFNFCFESTALLVSIFSTLFFCRPRLVWHQHSEIHKGKGRYLLLRLKDYFSKIGVLSYFVDEICAVSEAVKKQLLAKQVPERKITVVYNGVNLSRFNSEKRIAEIFPAIQLRNHTPVITTVSMLIPAKGLEYLLRAAAIVKRARPSIFFVIVGEGEYLSYLRLLASELKIQDNVYFAGKRSDVPEILCASDFFIIPSLKESLSYATIEAMAAGKTVIATRIGGLPEVVQDGISGILVVPADYLALAEAISRLLDNRDLTKAMGENARHIVEKQFSVERMVTKHLALYEQHFQSHC